MINNFLLISKTLIIIALLAHYNFAPKLVMASEVTEKENEKLHLVKLLEILVNYAGLQKIFLSINQI